MRRIVTMAEFRQAGVFLLLFCVPAICSIYVIPEYSINQSVDNLERKVQLPDNTYFEEQTQAINSASGQQSVKHAINDDDSSTYPSVASAVIDSSSSGNGQINNAMLAKKTSHQRRHNSQTSYDKNDDVVAVAAAAAALGGGVNDSNNNNNKNPSIFNTKETQTSLNDANNKQHNDEDEEIIVDDATNTQLISRQRRELADWLIAPNTRWCGRGNSANGTYNHLGGASRADKCCRKHDHCRLYIPAMSNRYGLFNYLPYTLSHCNCDIRFRTCLKMAGDEDANTIGQLYFNMVDTHCFVLVKEHVCQQRATDGTCAQEHIKKKAQLRSNKRF